MEKQSRKPGPLNAADRREKARLAYVLALQRRTYGEIGEKLDISRNLASTLVKEEQERLWEGRNIDELEEEKKHAIETYESVIRASWERLETIKDNSLNVSGLLNTILSSQKAIDEITGVKAAKEVKGNFTHEYVDLSGASEETVREIEQYLASLDT